MPGDACRQKWKTKRIETKAAGEAKDEKYPQ
jgi:hypothetical protein